VTVAERFAENLMVYRRRAKLSQEELGFLASLHRTEIGQLERGSRLPKIDTLVRLAGALSIPPGDLLKGVAWKASKTRPGQFLLSDPGASL
jgi:transcriptional regulator with XRE-family HTH domain